MLKANLFETFLKETHPQNPLTTDLRLATVSLDIKFNEFNIANGRSPKIGAISPNSVLAIWEENQMDAELLKTKYTPLIPSHMRIAYCWAHLWRVRPRKDLPSLCFECRIAPKQTIIDESIETGEHLFSKCFSFEDESISIGTEDEDSLFQRAEANENLPWRYTAESPTGFESYNLVESFDLGINVHLPPLKAGELVQLQFVIAGGPDPNANWFAVDARPSDILLQGECR